MCWAPRLSLATTPAARRDVPFEIELLAHIMANVYWFGWYAKYGTAMTPRPLINQCRLISQMAFIIIIFVRSFHSPHPWTMEIPRSVRAWPTPLFDNRKIIKFKVEDIGNTLCFALRSTSRLPPKGQHWNEHAAAWEPFWYYSCSSSHSLSHHILNMHLKTFQFKI